MGYEAPKDYNEVTSRILEFREKHPAGSLQSDDPIWLRDAKGEAVGVTIRTFAYRTPDDPRPGVGTAYEVFPGKTPYTKGSEVMNAETSAWGRALIAVGAADAKKGIASANEVRSAKASQQESEPADPVAVKRESVKKTLQAKGVTPDALKAFLADFGFAGLSAVSSVEVLEQVEAWAEAGGA